MIEKRIKELSKDFQLLKDKLIEYSIHKSKIENDILYIANRPWVAPENYLFTLFPTISDDKINKYQNNQEITIPESYKNILKQFNGAFIFNISLYGIPQSMLSNPPILDRSTLQCHDISTANKNWTREYTNIPDDLFHFGGRDFSFDEVIGYFIDKNNEILILRKNGEQIKKYSDIYSFLNEEIISSEKLENELEPPRW